jgi:hypothetical protein
MAITQQAFKLRPNELYNGGSSGVRTALYKYEFDGSFNQVQFLVGSKQATGTPGTYKVQFAVTDEIGNDTRDKAWLPRVAGVTYNDKSANGWKDATFSGAATKQIGLAANDGNNTVIHMSTDVMNLSSIPRADGKPGGILLVKVTQVDPSGQFYSANSAGNAWDTARGIRPWFRECRATGLNSDGIADLTKLPTDGYNGGYELPGFPIVTSTASAVPMDVVLFTGDSRKCAAYMTYLFGAPARMAAASLSTPGRPISTVNAAGSGHSQTQYQAIAMDMINNGLRPTLVHAPAFSQNGFSNFATFKTNLDNFIAAVRAVAGLADVKFVLDTDYGVKGYPGDAREGQRQQCIAYAKSLHNGTTVFCFDSDPIITDYSVTTTTGVPMYAPYRVGGDDIHVGPSGLNVLAYGAGSSSSLTQTYASALGATNVVVVPGAPTVGTATAGNGSASVGGTAPAATNGGAITGYRATSSPGGITATSATLPVNVTGLTAGTGYTFTLAALNSAGYGPESFASNSVTPTEVPAGDTTAPVMTGAITVSAITSSGFTLACDAATDAVGVAGYEYSIDGGTNYVVIANAARTVVVTGRSASTSHPVRMRAFDAAGNRATPLSATATTMAAADTTAPVMTGEITVSAITTSGATLSCSAATDAAGVAGYEYSINGGTSYTVIANSARSVTVSGRPASTAHAVRMRAFDAAGNRATPLSASFTTLAEQPAQNAVAASTVAESRRVAFPGGTRVVAFGSVPGARTPNAPYLEAGKWWSEKHPLDERYWVADITIDLAERGTTAVKVEAIVAGVTVLQDPVIQGNLIPIKLGGFNAATSAVNFCTFRVTCADGQRFDRTIWFKQPAGAWWINKDADDQSYYVADIGNDLIDSGTTATGVKAFPVGVDELVPAVLQGSLILVKLGGMDTLPAGVNYCDFRIDCANGERFYRSIQFNRVDN